MANLGLKVTDVLSKFYSVTEDEKIKGLYEIREKDSSLDSDILWYVFSSNNATYHAIIPKPGKSGKLKKAPAPTMVIRDINQSNSGYIKRLIEAYKKASKENKKIFWLVLVYGEGAGLNPSDLEWMASVELLVPVEEITASLTMRKFPYGKGMQDEWEPQYVRVEQDKYFNTTFISCKNSSGDFTDEYMLPYFNAYDNRPWNAKYFDQEDDAIDIGYLIYLDNSDFADQAIELMIQYELIDDEELSNLQDPDWSKTFIKRILPLLREIPEDCDEDTFKELRLDSNGKNNRYYDIRHRIGDHDYIVSNNWYEDSKMGFKKTEFTEHIAELLKAKGYPVVISKKITGAENVLFYGVPGSGKSSYIKRYYAAEKGCKERVVFHPDYTYSDFVGQIMPRLDGDDLIYKFVPGPFTQILKKAWENPKKKFYLIIEEINRGNAPAIFGEIFQLLDRNSVGESEYGITNYDIANELYDDEEMEVKIPSNLWILATMNTADQNVFTLDTAFQRRWIMKMIENNVEAAEHAEALIEGTDITWGAFATVVNDQVLLANEGISSSEDKRLGAYFALERELKRDRFPEKVLKYLWDDAFKMDREYLFRDDMKSLDAVIEKYEASSEDRLKAVIRLDVYQKMLSKLSAKSLPGVVAETDSEE